MRSDGSRDVRRIRIAVVAALLLLSVTPAASTASPSDAGSRLWAARFNSSAGLRDSPNAVTTSPDGATVFVTGTSEHKTSWNGVTLAYDASSGEELWKTRFRGWHGGDAGFVSLAVSADGGTLFVGGGASVDRLNAAAWVVIAYDATSGAELWWSRCVMDGFASTSDMGLAADGTMLFVTGADRSSAGTGGWATVAFDAATGDRLWVKHLYRSRGGEGYGVATALAISPDSETLFVTGYNQGRSVDYVTLAYDARSGSRLWLVRYGTDRDEGAFAVAVSPDGTRLFVAGETRGWLDFPLGSTSATIAYDAATGEEVWTKTSQEVHRLPASFPILEVSPDGNVLFATGSWSWSGNARDYATVALDASSGELLWGRRYDGHDADPFWIDDIPYAMALDADGSTIFVTGGSGHRVYGNTSYGRRRAPTTRRLRTTRRRVGNCGSGASRDVRETTGTSRRRSGSPPTDRRSSSAARASGARAWTT